MIQHSRRQQQPDHSRKQQISHQQRIGAKRRNQQRGNRATDDKTNQRIPPLFVRRLQGLWVMTGPETGSVTPSSGESSSKKSRTALRCSII